MRFEHLILILSCVATMLASSPTTSAQTGEPDEIFGLIEARVEAEYPSLQELYMHLHTHPELSYHEVEVVDASVVTGEKYSIDLSQSKVNEEVAS